MDSLRGLRRAVAHPAFLQCQQGRAREEEHIRLAPPEQLPQTHAAPPALRLRHAEDVEEEIGYVA